MDDVETVRAAFSFPDPEQADELIADSFQWSDADGTAQMDKATWIGMGDIMEASFPDMDYVIEDISQEEAGVRVTGYFVGTFANDFDLSPMGLGVVPATGEKIQWPASTALVTVENGKVTAIRDTEAGPDSGMAGFLKPLGVG